MKALQMIAMGLLGSFFIIIGCSKENSSDDNTSVTSSGGISATGVAYIVNGGDNSLSVIDLSVNKVIKTIDLQSYSNGKWPHHVYVNPAKTKIAIAQPGVDMTMGHSGVMSMDPGYFLVLDAQTGALIKNQQLASMNHNAIFSPDGSEIWTSQMKMNSSMVTINGTVLVYDANTFQLKNTINVGKEPTEVTFSNDGTKAFVVNEADNTVTAIQVSNKTVLATITVGQGPVGAWVGSDNYMYVDNEGGKSISVIDATPATPRLIGTIALGFMPGMVACNISINELWVTAPEEGKVYYYYQQNPMPGMFMDWTKKGSIATGDGAHAVAFNGNNTAYVTNQLAGTVSILDVKSHTKITDVTVGKNPNGMAIRN